MSYITSSDPIRYIDKFQVQSHNGMLYSQLFPLFTIVNQGGKRQVTAEASVSHNSSIPTIADSNYLDDVIVRDEKTGKLFLKTTTQSRFLDYGFDPATANILNNILVQDYTGQTAEYSQRDTLNSPVISLFQVNYGDDGKFTDLGLARLMMLISMKRAEALEEVLQEQLERLTGSNAKLDSLAQISDLCVNGGDETTLDTTKEITYMNKPITIAEFLVDIMKESGVGNAVDKKELYEKVKSWQDDLNNVSQETMLNIQKFISMRDQAYLLGSVGDKLLQNGNVMVSRNI